MGGEHFTHTGKPARATLSRRETEILRWIGTGHSDQAIGKTLFIAAKTVETHRANIYSKLGIHSRYEAMIYAIRNGLAPCPHCDDKVPEVMRGA